MPPPRTGASATRLRGQVQVDEVCVKDQGDVLRTELAMIIFTRLWLGSIVRNRFTPRLAVRSLPRMEQLRLRLSDPDGAALRTQAGGHDLSLINRIGKGCCGVDGTECACHMTHADQRADSKCPSFQQVVRRAYMTKN